MEELEYNILGSKIKISSDEANVSWAKEAIKVVTDEIEALKKANSKLNDIDAAVLVSLKMAAKSIEFENEFKDTVSFFKAELGDTLNIVESAIKSEK